MALVLISLKCIICKTRIYSYYGVPNVDFSYYINGEACDNICFKCYCDKKIFISKTSAMNNYFLSDDNLREIYSFTEKNKYDSKLESTYYILDDVINLSNIICQDREERLEKKLSKKDEKIKRSNEEINEEIKNVKIEEKKREYHIKSMLEKTYFPDKNINNNKYFKKYIETGEQYAESNIFGQKKSFDSLKDYIDYIDDVETRKIEINEKIDNLCPDRSIVNIIKTQIYYKKYILNGGNLIDNIEDIINDKDGDLFFKKYYSLYIKDIKTKNPKLTIIKHYIKNNENIANIPKPYYYLIEKAKEIIIREKINHEKKKIKM